MKIYGSEKLIDFVQLYPRAQAPLERWQFLVHIANWENFSKLKEAFRSADYFEGFVIFDIGGNKFRLIADVLYDKQSLYVQQILTHEEYDKNKWKRKGRDERA